MELAVRAIIADTALCVVAVGAWIIRYEYRARKSRRRTVKGKRLGW